MRRWIFCAGFLFLAAALWAQFGGFGPGRGEGGGDRTIAANAVGPVQTSQRVFTTTVSGRLQPANSVDHSSSVAGIVSDVSVSVGQRVAAGDALYTIKRADGSGNYAPAVVTARVAGLVSTVSVRPNKEVRSGEVGVTIIDTAYYLMRAFISDKDVLSIRVGRAVEGRNVDGTTVKGVLEARSPEPDYQTGLFSLTFRFDGTSSTFPGEFISVDLPVETLQGIFIPQNLLFRRYGRYYVWVVGPETTLNAREVTAGRSSGNDIQITAGLKPGDIILLRRQGNEQEGMKVEGASG